MAYWLADRGTAQATGFLSRFDPRFWTVDFPRPMMASVVATGPDSLRVDAVFYRSNDLAGLIWASEDRIDHPLLAYETARDYRHCRLAFRWRSSGLRPLDAVNGPTLTIEGRDAAGNARSWYVRLWNYASGAPDDADVLIDFSSLDGGFVLPEEADPVWAGDIDRMFISLVAPGYSGDDALLTAPAEAWVELSEISCGGSGSIIGIGDVVLPEHGLGVATGYDDSYNVTPARLLRNMLQLGYRGSFIHYVGMSHYLRLEASGGGLYASLAGGVLNTACAAWHRDLATRAHALGLGIIWSLSYELFDQHCWGDWKQRISDGSPALTGWVPPSTLLSPAHQGAMSYLQQVAQAFTAIGVAAGLAPQFQVGEPWWWVMPDGRPCLYDDAARAAFAGTMPDIGDVRGQHDSDQQALLDFAGALLAVSTAALVAAARAVAPELVTHLLVYLPGVLADDAPDVQRMNLPVAWSSPAFDVLQIEDYDWVVAGDEARSARATAAASIRLGYGNAGQHYLSGFILRPERSADWAQIDAAAEGARARGVARSFLWAMPQIQRDGFIHFDQEASDVQAFDDVLFPIALGRAAEVAPEFSTAIIVSAGGREARNASWSGARTSYDVGPGIRSESDIAALLDFFRARLGPARAFRLRDPFDSSSAMGDGDPGPLDQPIGVGDGVAVRFALVKHHGEQQRRITRPVIGSLRVALDGVETNRFVAVDGGWVVLDVAPAAGVPVTAGFRFDVPVRFADDKLSVNRSTFLAGEAASVPLIEVRED